MRFLKFSLVAGASLLALIIASGSVLTPTASAVPKDSWSLDVLRKMANHGELRPFATFAAAGPFLPMPAVAAPTPLASAAPVSAAPAPVATPIAAPTPSVRDAQARVAEADVSDRALLPAKKTAKRKAKPHRTVFVENMRGPGGFFGIQSW